eukprot:6176189-Pleurochrysis_carterae.AAC.6
MHCISNTLATNAQFPSTHTGAPLVMAHPCSWQTTSFKSVNLNAERGTLRMHSGSDAAVWPYR